MNRQNWYPDELVDVQNMDSIESAAQGGINALTSYFNNRGIVSGLRLGQTAVPSLSVLAPEGIIVLEDGTIVSTIATGNPNRSIDLTPFVPAAGQPNVVVNIFAIPVQNSDTPLVTPAGTTINYRLFDDFNLVGQVQVGAELQLTGNATYTGTLLGQVSISPGWASVDNDNISLANTQYWLTVPEILSRSKVLPNYIQQNYDANLNLDASVSNGWDVLLTGNVGAINIANSSVFQILRFAFQQDGAGGRTVAWPATFKGFPPIAVDANTTSFIEGVQRADGNVYATSAMVFFNPAL